MKKTKLMHQIFTGLFAALMAFTAVPNVLMLPDAMTFMAHLGYPAYFTPFIGVAKILGAICIVLPGFRTLKEWAYAGFFFDLIGAHYSQIANGDPAGPTFFMLVFYLIGALSYIYHHKRLREKQVEEVMTVA
jgi:hypothetical protein